MPMSLGSFASRVVATNVVAQDGTGDFTDIEKAYNDLPAEGGAVWVKEGTYTITDSIGMDKSNSAIIGSGRASEIIADGTYGINIGDITNALIENLSFTSTNGYASIVASTGTPKQILIKGNYFHNVAGNVFDIRTGNFAIAQNIVDSCGSAANNRTTMSFNTSNSIITGNIIKNSELGGICLIGTGTDNIVSNNVVVNQGQIAIDVGSPKNSVVGNICHNSGQHGISVSWTGKVIVRNNLCRNNTRHGILIEESSDCVVGGNSCIANDSGDTASYDGINVSGDSDNTVVTGNRCMNNDRYEINIASSTCDKTLVLGNSLLGTDHQGALNDSGTNTEAAHNITV